MPPRQSPPDWSPPRQPRRLGLWAPLALLLIGAAALTLVWFGERDQILTRLDSAREAGGGGGSWSVDWTSRRVSGFPFRLDLDLTDVRLREPSGWGLTAPTLKAEAFVFSPTHWMIVAPDGVRLGRRRAGPLVVRAKVLRASLSEITAHPPRVSVEGIGLTFVEPARSRTFPVRSAAELHIHTRAGPADQGAVYVEIDRAQARLPGLMGRIADGKPITLVVDALFSHASALAGETWPTAARAWSEAGGVLSLRRLRLDAGRAVVDARPGDLSVGSDGRVRGALTLSLGQAPLALAAMGEEGALAPDTERAANAVAAARATGPTTSLTLQFQAGRVTLGPVDLGPAPRIY